MISQHENVPFICTLVNIPLGSDSVWKSMNEPLFKFPYDSNTYSTGCALKI